MTIARREWIAPGILITALTLFTNFASDWAVERYRSDGVQESLQELRAELKRQNDSTNRRIDGLDSRLQDMVRGEKDTARLQEANRALEARLSEMRADIKEQEGRNQARYENLSTRLARAGA